MTEPITESPGIARRRSCQIAILGGLVFFTLALCTLVVVMMLRRGPAVAY